MKKIKKVTSLALAMIISVAVLTACDNGTSTDKTDQTKESVKGGGSKVIKTSDKEYDDYVVRVINDGGLCTAAVQMAYEQGFFEEEGVKVEMIQSGGSTLQDLMTSNKADISQDMLPNTVLKIDNGLDVNIALGMQTGCLSVLVKPESDIKDVSDLQGKKIGVPALGSSAMAIAQRALADAGISTKPENMEVEFVAFSGPELAMVLENGTVDAVVGSDPLSQTIVQEGVGKVIFSNTDHPDYKDEYCCIIALNPKFVEEHPVAAEKAMRAIQKATKFVRENPEETAKIQVEKNYIPKADPKFYSDILKTYTWGGSVEGGREGFRNNLVDLEKLGLIKGDMDVEKLIDKVYIEFENLEDSVK